MILYPAILCAAYLIGSCPFGFILTKCLRGGDIRQAGSGNIGATNVMRHMGKKVGYLTFVLDSSKGMVALWICGMMHPLHSITDYYVVGIAAVIGHCFPVWLRFKGGKGVSTALGVIAYTQIALHVQDWWVILMFACIWIGTFFASKMVSLASLATFIALPIIMSVLYGVWSAPLVLSLIVIIRHHANIKRLLSGTEHRFVKKKK
jgi:acyl phosphate:glycerol-3-phosphate acyltransferase